MADETSALHEDVEEQMAMYEQAGLELAEATAWERVEAGMLDEAMQESLVDEDGHAEIDHEGAGTADEVDELVDGTVGAGETAGGTATEVETYLESDTGMVVQEVEGFEPEESLVVEMEPEIVHGTDDRVRVFGTTAFPWRTICHLRITTATGGTAYCSGSLIGPRTVLTNGHCMYLHGHGGWARRIEVAPGRNGSSTPFGTATSSHFISTKGWVNNKSSNYDYGVIILPSNKKLGNNVGWMGLANLSFFSLMGLNVNNSGYPGDKPFGTQWWNANNILAVTSRRVYYRIDTYAGQSGSPVWRYKNGKRHIVAVHNTGGSPFNGSVRLSKPVFDNLVSWKKAYT